MISCYYQVSVEVPRPAAAGGIVLVEVPRQTAARGIRARARLGATDTARTLVDT